MGVQVKLRDIVVAIDFQPNESSSYLNLEAGAIITVTEEDFAAVEGEDNLDDYPQWQQESIKAAREIQDHEDRFIELPTKYDIHEYEIMEKFILSLKDQRISDSLYRAIKGRGAFRRFKDEIIRCDVERDWFRYRDAAIRQIAIDWCEHNKIEFLDKSNLSGADFE